MNALKCALVGVAFLAAAPALASPPLETDTIVGLMVKANPKLVDRKAVETFARFVWCHEYAPLQNQFQREDYLNDLAERMTSLGASSFGKIEGVTRKFSFYNYDFKTETLQINRGDYDWARTAPVGNFLNPQNRPCWQNLGNMFSFTPVVEALPEWNKIPFKLSVPKEEARAWFTDGNPSAVLTFSMNVEKYTVEPMGSPKYILRGPTTEWELLILNGKGEQVKRFSEERALHKTLPFAAPSAASSSLKAGTSRIATAGINVRERPALDGPLMSTIGANSVFDVGDASPDGQWTRVTVAPIVRGWANNAVILKSSVPNSPAADAQPSVAAQSPEKPDSETLKQKIMFLMTGLDGPPYREVEEFHNAHGDHIKTKTHTYEPTFESPCVVKLRYTSAAKKHTQTFGMDLDNYTATRRFDFTKMTRITVRYTDQPEEGMWWGFAGGSSNPRLVRKPRLVNLIDYFGEGASCSLKNDGTPNGCSEAEQSNGNFPYPNPSKRPKHFQDAFSAVKAACTNSSQPSTATVSPQTPNPPEN